MDSKKCQASDTSGSAKKRQAISIETKVTIIKKFDSGEKMVNVARTFNINCSTIGTIYKSKDCIMEHVKSAVPKKSTIISKKRDKLIEETEKLFSHWMEHQWQRRVRLKARLQPFTVLF